MSADKSAVNLPQLFNDLSRFEAEEEFDRAAKVAKKILNEDKDNEKALHCLIVCKIRLGLFEDAIQELNKCQQNLQNQLKYEKAYTQYRLNDVEEAVNTLDSIERPDFKVFELRAQALYRLERFEECYDQYLQLIKTSDDDYEDERQTNLSAVVACLSIKGGADAVKNKADVGEQTFELCYNKACVLLGQKKYDEALNKLNRAEDLCRKTLEEEDASEEEIESELAIIRAQIGYCYQMQKKEETALRMFNQILRQKPDDPSVMAVVCNNIVTINREQNVFDSKKKMKSALNEAIDSKLLKLQKQSIVFNNCLLLLHTNQSDPFRKQLEEIKTKYPQMVSESLLLEAALLCKEKKTSDAIKFLKQHSEQNPSLSLELHLVLTQLLIREGRTGEACSVLRSLKDSTYKPGIIATLITLYLSLEDNQSATSLLTEAVNWYEKKKPNSPELHVLYRENARFLMQTNQPKAAVSLLERLRQKDPQNPRILSLLISAYSQFDPNKANEVSKDLPPIESIISSVDVEQLETSNWSLGAKYVKKTTKTDTPNVNANKVEKKKKRKKKTKLPKNYDPKVEPDPERWLPRYQRSTYKKKKDKRGLQSVGKGTQGAVGELDPKATQPRPTATSAAQSPPGPRQQRPTGGVQKKKKKSSRR